MEVENPGSIYNGDRVVLEGWVLNVTNKSTRLVRDVGGLSEWVQYNSGDSRFLAGSAVKQDVGRYRIFWAVDCNYSDSDGHEESDFDIYDNATALSDIDWNTSWEEKTNVAYCLENTFDTKHQDKNETTSVLIKGRYNRSEDAAVKSLLYREEQRRAALRGGVRRNGESGGHRAGGCGNPSEFRGGGRILQHGRQEVERPADGYGSECRCADEGCAGAWVR